MYSKVYSLVFCHSQFFFIGCVISAPDGPSSRGYGRQPVVNHRLKTLNASNAFFFLAIKLSLYYPMIFLSGARPALPMGVDPEAMIGCWQSIIV
jgi:hypothetical protein